MDLLAGSIRKIRIGKRRIVVVQRAVLAIR